MAKIALSLGHNASAILVKDDEIVFGIEEERLTRVKSDSRFPVRALAKAISHSHEPITDIYLSHWFPDPSQFRELKYLKYFNTEWLDVTLPDAKIHNLSKDFTHHDAHAWSCMLYMQNDVPDYIVVADGFGNYGECFSIYHRGEDRLTLKYRLYGYSRSLGLLYQYATAYLGLKENQDEYKLLGYESSVYDSAINLERLNNAAQIFADNFLREINKSDILRTYDPVISISALPNTRIKIFSELGKILRSLKNTFNIYDEYVSRQIVSYIIQFTVETVVCSILNKLLPDEARICCTGGLFYNVKLNGYISQTYDAEFMPLAGDQGAALGHLYNHNKDLKWPGHVYWGLRNADSGSFEQIEHHVINALRKDKIVNLFHGPMEFGPRALGHTSTLAMPTTENFKYINFINGRNSIMPMAPIMTIDQARNRLTRESAASQTSNRYMIKAEWLMPLFVNSIPGASLRYNEFQVSCRPQIIDENHKLHDVVRKLGPLINTSFNKHGTPIVYSKEDAMESFNYQVSRDFEGRVCLIS